MDLLRPYPSSFTPNQREDRVRITRACEQAFAACARLPQFLEMSFGDHCGLYNLLNGCFVRIAHSNPAALTLKWTPFAAGEGCRGPQLVVLDTERQVSRFLAVMQAQAKALDLRLSDDADHAVVVP